MNVPGRDRVVAQDTVVPLVRVDSRRLDCATRWHTFESKLEEGGLVCSILVCNQLRDADILVRIHL